MSWLTDNPEIMLEVILVLVRRSGGEVSILPHEDPGPFNLLSKFEHGALHLKIVEDSRFLGDAR